MYGNYLMKQDNVEEGIHWIQLEAEAGHPEAMSLYANCLKTGYGVHQNLFNF
jgi:TPR repeat protein